jgi:hypothetical protein
LLGVEAVAAATEEAVFMAVGGMEATVGMAGFVVPGFVADGVGVVAAGVGAAVGVGAAAGMEGAGDILIGAGAILILILILILTGVTGAVITEAATAATAVTGAATAVTENSRIGRFPKNLCSTTGLERGVQNA